MNKILLCCDMDRTVIPNGHAQESPHARLLFTALIEQHKIMLVYVTGRHKKLIEQAIQEYNLPVPDYAIADVGSTIYNITQTHWEIDSEWHESIAPDWRGKQRSDLKELLIDYPELTLQESEKQNQFKLSYYAPENTKKDILISELKERFKQHSILASFIWSIDDITHQGLLDILPSSANKLHAIRFLMEKLKFNESNTVFAGDSGNDMEVLVSSIKSIIVGNATDNIKQEALQNDNVSENKQQLYIAQGNYSTGIIEGLKHYFPGFS